MAIEFNCPYCTAGIRVADAAAGKVGRCPKCNTRLRVPAPEPPADAAPADPPVDEPVSTLAVNPHPKPPAPREGDFEAPSLDNRPGNSEPAGATDDAAGAVVIPDVPEPHEHPVVPFIDTSHAAEPVYQRVTRTRHRNWTAILAPLICGGILVAAGIAYWWAQRETMTGELSGERLPPQTTVSAVIPRFVPDVPTEIWQASLAGLGEDPVIVQSELMRVEFRGSRRGLVVTVSAGEETDLVRVDVRRNRLLNQFYIDQGQMLNEDRNRELKDAATRFLQDWNNAASSGMLMGNGQQYRDSAGLDALTGGLGYHSVALVGNTLYPCVHEDEDGRLYFALPHNVDEFVVTEREFPDRDSVFPGEYRFTVRIVAPPEQRAPEETETPMDGANERGDENPPGEMSPDTTMPPETSQSDADSGSEQR